MKTKILSSRIEERLVNFVKRYCIDNGIKIQSFITEALITELELRRHDGEQPFKFKRN